MKYLIFFVILIFIISCGNSKKNNNNNNPNNPNNPVNQINGPASSYINGTFQITESSCPSNVDTFQRVMEFSGINNNGYNQYPQNGGYNNNGYNQYPQNGGYWGPYGNNNMIYVRYVSATSGGQTYSVPQGLLQGQFTQQGTSSTFTINYTVGMCQYIINASFVNSTNHFEGTWQDCYLSGQTCRIIADRR